MAGSKKPRKKHNRNAVILRASDYFSRRSFVMSVIKLGDYGQLYVMNGVQKKNESVTRCEYDLIFDAPRPWSFVFGVACRYPDGATGIQIEYLELKQRHKYTSREIKEFVDRELNNIIQQQPDVEHIVSPFFIASADRHEFSNQEINKWLNRLKTFQTLKTPHEVGILRENGLDELRKIDPVPFCSKTTWSVLRGQGVENFADLRVLGVNTIKKLRGIGEKRSEELIEGYRKLLSKFEGQECIANLEEFEKQIYLFQNSMKNLTVHAKG